MESAWVHPITINILTFSRGSCVVTGIRERRDRQIQRDIINNTFKYSRSYSLIHTCSPVGSQHDYRTARDWAEERYYNNVAAYLIQVSVSVKLRVVVSVSTMRPLNTYSPNKLTTYSVLVSPLKHLLVA